MIIVILWWLSSVKKACVLLTPPLIICANPILVWNMANAMKMKILIKTSYVFFFLLTEPYHLYFAVKFYPPNPTALVEDITR